MIGKAAWGSRVAIVSLGALACLVVCAFAFIMRSRDPEGATDMPSTAAASQLAELSILDAALSTGATWSRISAVHGALEASFHVAPKDATGRRLSSLALRDVVAGHFAKEHGWLLAGLEPPAYSVRSSESQVHEAAVLRDQAPRLVRALETAQRTGRGASLTEAAAVVAALEGLLLGEADRLLEAAYRLNGVLGSDIDSEGVREVLQSYQMIYEQGDRANKEDMRAHQEKKASRAETSATWEELVQFVDDSLFNYEYAHRHNVNPFGSRRYSFDEAASITRSMAAHFGVWQDSDCQLMKTHLSSLDATGSGSVLLSDFHSQPAEAAYQFSETVDYLQSIGALDQSQSQPRVRIANYLLGSSNCIAAHAHFSVCCLNECDRVWDELGREIGQPTATASRILEVVGNLSTSSVDAPRGLPQNLVDSLVELANAYRGEVPLRGRSFGGWLHSAFPKECPFPKALPEPKFLQPVLPMQPAETCLAQPGGQVATARCGRRPSEGSHRSL